MKKQKLAVLISLSSALMLTACGGSSSSNDSANAGDNKVVRGSIDGFGSVIVNGVRYETDQATISVNDTEGAQSDLSVGQIVTLYANSNGNRNVADDIIYDLDLKGPVANIDATANTFTVLGQTVLVSNLTSYKGVTWPLTAGQSVEVSGYVKGNELVASFVELNDVNDTEVELRGVIANLNETAQTFDIGSQTISYTTTTELDLEGQALANDLQVEVEGNLVNGVFTATEIEADDETLPDGVEIELAGALYDFNGDAKTFTVNGTPVTWNNQTDFDDGTSAANLADDVSVEVEGVVNANGVLVAEDIEIEDDASISIEAQITNITAGNDNFSGTITVLGLDVSVGLDTRMSDDDDSLNFNPMFNFSNLNNGNKVELEVTGDATNGYRAASLERDLDQEEANVVELEVLGAAVINNNGEYSVLGINLVAANDGVILSDLATITATEEVSFTGTVSGNTFTVTEFELDD